MNRIFEVCGWGIAAGVFGLIVGACVGFAAGLVRGDNLVQMLLAGAVSVGIIGAFGATVGGLLQRKPNTDSGALPMWTFIAAVLGAMLGALGGEALGADVWLLENIASIENKQVAAFLAYHANVIGGAGATAGMVFGILICVLVDTFYGEDATGSAVLIALALTMIGASASAIAHGNWGVAVVVGVVIVFALRWLLSSENQQTETKDDSSKSKAKESRKAK